MRILFRSLAILTGLSFLGSASAFAAGSDSALKGSLEQALKVYEFYDCTKKMTDDSLEDLLQACKTAHKNPDVAQDTKNGALQCSFDGKSYRVGLPQVDPESASSPSFEISETGELKKIASGDLSVNTSTCKTIFDKNGTTKISKGESSELCFAYAPDLRGVPYRETPICSEEIKKSADDTRMPSSPKDATAESALPTGHDVAPAAAPAVNPPAAKSAPVVEPQTKPADKRVPASTDASPTEEDSVPVVVPHGNTDNQGSNSSRQPNPELTYL